MHSLLPHSKSRFLGWGVLLIAVISMLAGESLYAQNYNNSSNRNNNRSSNRSGNRSGGSYGGGYGDYEDYSIRDPNGSAPFWLKSPPISTHRPRCGRFLSAVSRARYVRAWPMTGPFPTRSSSSAG